MFSFTSSKRQERGFHVGLHTQETVRMFTPYSLASVFIAAFLSSVA